METMMRTDVILLTSEETRIIAMTSLRLLVVMVTAFYFCSSNKLFFYLVRT